MLRSSGWTGLVAHAGGVARFTPQTKRRAGRAFRLPAGPLQADISAHFQVVDRDSRPPGIGKNSRKRADRDRRDGRLVAARRHVTISRFPPSACRGLR
jgi:hypothetical protein